MRSHQGVGFTFSGTLGRASMDRRLPTSARTAPARGTGIQ